MLNYVVDPAILRDHVPFGTELDTFDDRCFVSVVGFLFVRTRVYGLAVPLHTRFEEVNLRFYVRRKGPRGWRRGVVFMKELVPRRAIAWVARTLYAENYVALPMRHTLHETEDGHALSYGWKRPGAQVWEGLDVRYRGTPAPVAAGSEEEFITEHYFGYSAQPDGSTLEYEVEHPSWQVWRADDAVLRCDASALYGPAVAPFLAGEPTTRFVANGSPVSVRRGEILRA